MGSSDLVPKRIVNANGVETTVYVRRDQLGNLEGSQLKTIGAPLPSTSSVGPDDLYEISLEMSERFANKTAVFGREGDDPELAMELDDGHVREDRLLDSALICVKRSDLATPQFVMKSDRVPMNEGIKFRGRDRSTLSGIESGLTTGIHPDEDDPQVIATQLKAFQETVRNAITPALPEERKPGHSYFLDRNEATGNEGIIHSEVFSTQETAGPYGDRTWGIYDEHRVSDGEGPYVVGYAGSQEDADILTQTYWETQARAEDPEHYKLSQAPSWVRNQLS